MTKDARIFHNDQLNKAVKKAMPWLDSWNQFKEAVEADIVALEELLNAKQIPISAWIDVGDKGSVGWAVDRKSKSMRLQFRRTEHHKPTPLSSESLEVKIMVFPYLSELSYLLCTKIKLAHTSHVEMDRYGEDILGTPAQTKHTEVQPVFIAKYV